MSDVTHRRTAALQLVRAAVRRSVAVPRSVAADAGAGAGRRSGPIVAIDGPSGSGKSTFADELAADWPGGRARLVRLDEVYPGWHGLAAAAGSLDRTLLAPHARGVPGGWRRWDWSEGRRAGAVVLPPGGPLILEGCGAFEAVTRRPGAVRVWLQAADDTRRLRALARDAGRFDPYWELWETEWRRYVRRVRPLRSADLVVTLPAVD
ncbi:ATP-binding protein [Agromyces italicus]|uniref:ATP-binding protein n=1 Tax=Agromyces italicus TaxID=279572 RepID=UPI001FE0AE70|nr:ATP-binding protein [Agromyces italicus]